MTTKQVLQKAWEEYKGLNAEGVKLFLEGYRPYAKGANLYAEGQKCLSQAKRLWRKAVRSVYGDMAWEWTWNKKWQSFECRLANGEVYGFTEEGESV